MKHVEVAIAIVVHDGWVLICQRKDAGELAGYWEFPGGKREENESIEHCLHREIKEELDIEVEITDPLPPREHEYPNVAVTLHPFLCRWTGGEAKAIGCQQFLWTQPQELGAYQFPPANQPLIQWLAETLGASEHEVNRQPELDGLHIRQVAKAKQAAMRLGSYWLIAALACGVGAIDLLWRAVRWYWALRQIAQSICYALAALALLILGSRFFAKAHSLGKEARRQSPADPPAPPDFSTLSDGSQIAKDLEHLR